MRNFSEEVFFELATMKEPLCISIFMPTHRAGKEVKEQVDRINLKNQIQDLTKELEALQLKPREIEDLLDPIIKLMEDSGFWSHQSDGLAIFRSKDYFEYWTLPVLFESFIYISDHYYLKPVVPYLNDDGKYYLLALSLSGAKLYEGFPHQINEIEVSDLLPERLEDAVGYDFKEKHLQFRTGQSDKGGAIYHGHGSGDEEEKLEILKFFRAINTGLMKFLKNKKRPMVLATVDYLVPIYQEVNDYPHLRAEFIAGNPEHEDPVVLHEKVRQLLADFFKEKRNGLLASFEPALSHSLASFKAEEIVPAAFHKQVEILFIKNREVMWGSYDQNTNTIKADEKQSGLNTCLLNFAAVHTMLNNGEVYILEADEMPVLKTNINAILRY
jgi:hypothetical protein